MNLSAVYHRSTGSDCYALDKDTVVLNLHTGYDVEKAFVVSEDPFRNELERKPKWEGKCREMKRGLELEQSVIWTIELRPPYKRLQYYFIAEAGAERYCLFENKICTPEEREIISTEFFKFPWLNPADVIRPPRWVRDTVWYQIMPDRFCRSKDAPPDEKFRRWGDFSDPHWNDLYGGNLRGIKERLPYLQSLGVSGLYLTPIFLSNTNHKYNTFDYYQIDPDFGTEADLKALVKDAHQRGMRVMLDAVFNHCGHNFFAWKDVCENGRQSRYFDWFFINSDDFLKDDFTTADGRYFTFSFWSPMPKLNTNNPQVRKYFTELCLHWVRDYGIDGIRFDVGDEISHLFLRELRTALKAENDEFFMLGEIWFDSIGWLGGDEYDSVMDYPFTGALGDFWRDKTMSWRALRRRLDFCRSLYPRQINEVMFNFLDTHDTPRVRETCGSDDVMLQKLAVLLTFSGTPCLYYGTEIAMRGKKDPFNRACMPWEDIDAGKYDDLKEKIARLIALRRDRPALKRDVPDFAFDDKHPRLVRYSKGDVTVVLNAESESVPVSTDGEILFENGFDGASLKPDGILIYHKK